jgi:hypothetical protein
MCASHTFLSTRSELLQNTPNNDRRPASEHPPVAAITSPTVSDTSLTDSESTIQFSSGAAWTQSRYSTTATSSYESRVPTTADVYGFRHSGHGTRPVISEADVKHEYTLTSYDNQLQEAFDNLEPSSLISLLDPERDSLPLPLPTLYSQVTGELGGVIFLGKEGSRTGLLDTEVPHEVRLEDGVRGSTSMPRQHESQPAQSSTSIGTATLVQTSRKGDTSTSAVMTSSRWIHDPAISRIDWSTPISKQGVEVILISVVGGSLAFIAIVLLHRLVFRSFRRKNEQSDHLSSLSLANNSSREGSDTRISDAVEVSHFSIES